MATAYGRGSLGVDAGGSTLRAVYLSDEGRILDRMTLSGNINITSAGLEKIREVFTELKEKVPSPCSVHVAMAGVGDKKAHADVFSVISCLYPHAKILLRTDAEGALFANFPNTEGVLVICGTGSAVFAKNAGGVFNRAGGWGFLMGDEASGFWLVKEVARHYLMYCDGHHPFQPCFRVIQAHFPEDPRELIVPFYTPHQRNRVAGYSRLLMQSSDPWLWNLIDQGLMIISGCVKTLADTLSISPVPIAIMGGMFQHELFHRRFADIVQANLPSSAIQEGVQDIALALAGQR